MRFLPPVLLAVLVVAALVCAWGTPSAWRAWRLYAAGDDPAARAEVRLEESLTAPQIAAGIGAAVKAEDEELATSFIALAAARSVSVDPQAEARVAAMRAEGAAHALRDFGEGFVDGERANFPALIGSTTSDLLGFGDLRDLWREGQKVLAGGTADEVTVGLAAAGLALSVATLTSIGAALPERAGVSALKVAQKTGRLSRALTASLAQLAAKALDREALAATVAAIGRADVVAARAAAKRVLRPAALKGLEAVGRDAGEIYAKAGARGLNDALALAQSEGELRQAARLAAKEGVKTRAVLALLGRSALIGASLAGTAVFWSLALLGQLLVLAAMTQRLGWRVGESLFTRREKARFLSCGPEAGTLGAN
jgi:hypothetical protein